MHLAGREIGEPASWFLGLAAITFALAGPERIVNPGFYTSPYFIAILIAFAVHELAHREVSRMYGLASMFVAYPPGLLLTILSGFIPGIVILAPGYVKTLVFRPVHPRAILYSVAAGPASNIVLALASLALIKLVDPHSFLGLLAASSVYVNSWVAFFNLLPFPPLDGSKIVARDRTLWIAMFATSMVLLVLA